ncbi:hypothetical protein [Rheinheimera texasensis]|uniref:hypothetical protein n=1 Tax=Rheinheimera texasensis TaxID=306205 RepID=UPI0032B2ED32
MQIKSKEDSQLLFLTGFCKTVISKTSVKTVPDLSKIAAFFLVSIHTARRWLRDGLPKKVTHQLKMLSSGHLLPPPWQRAQLTICAEGIVLQNGRILDLACIQFWPFIAPHVDWSRVPSLVIQRMR